MALIPKKIRYGGKPLDIGVPGAGFDRRQAVRAWEIAVRLREQAARFRLQCDIPDAFPESKVGLEALEAGIQLTAKRLAPKASARFGLGSALLILEDVHDPTCLLCTLQ